MRHKILMGAWCTFMGYNLVLQGVQWWMAMSGLSWSLALYLWLAGAMTLALGWVSLLVHVIRALRRWWYYKRIQARVNKVDKQKQRGVRILKGGTEPVLYKDKDFQRGLVRVAPLSTTKPSARAVYEAKIQRVRARAMRGDPSAIAWCIEHGHADGIPGAITMAALGLDFIQGNQ
jgi:hypothetical protein